jgi:hypothetical protein
MRSYLDGMSEAPQSIAVETKFRQAAADHTQPICLRGRV